MNKYIIFLTSLILCFGCDKEGKYSTTYEYIIVNPLNRHFKIEMTGIGSESKDTVFATISAKNISYIIGKTITKQHRVVWGECYSYFFTTLYNLTDTTKIIGDFGCQVRDWTGHPYNEVERSPFAYYSEYRDSIFGEYDTKVIVTLTITDTLLQRMQKDYTMLDKFKDYYFQPH